MITYVFDWVKDIVFYFILMTMIMHLLPNKQYQKYVRFFSGMILVLIVITPMTRLLKWDQVFDFHYLENSYEQQVASMETQIHILESNQEQNVMNQYKKEVEEMVQNLVKNYGYDLASCEIAIVEDEKDERYLFPKNIKVCLKQHRKESAVDTVKKVTVQMIDEASRKEQSAEVPEFHKIRNDISEFYHLEPANIMIQIQE